MQINNISNCHKPKSFTGIKQTGKVRYKHYEQMSDQALSAYSMGKAYCEVKDSKKSKLLKAMPYITNTLIATSLAVTQPGKLSTKASTGVGFLALMGCINLISNGFAKLADKALVNKENNDESKLAKKAVAGAVGIMGAIATVVGGAVLIAKNKTSILNSSNKVVNFLKGEAAKLKEEINATKLAKTVEEKLNPFMEKHAKAFTKAKYLAPFGIILGSGAADFALRDSISNDLSKKAVQNFIKGKAAQQDARAHFDSIDAIEV